MGGLISREAVRLIDANALEKHLINIANTMQDAGFESYAGAMGEAAAIVHSRPAVDAEPVRHGRWIHDINNLYGCSECRGRETMSHRNLKKYCPNCGAKMDKEGEV